MTILSKIIRMLFFASFLAILIFSNKASATDVESERPAVFWGVATVGVDYSSDGTKPQHFNSEPKDTIVVRNNAPMTAAELLFNNSCRLGSSILNSATANCFRLDTSSLIKYKLYNSRSYANGLLKSATAVVVYPDINVVGDTSGTSSNFAYWGRHLNQVSGTNSSNSFWKLSNYSISDQAQAYWSDSGNATMTTTIDRLLKNATDLNTSGALPPHFDGVCKGFIDSNCSFKSQYPEGRVWKNSGVLTAGGVQYKNKSTIIIDNGLNINGSVEYSDSGSNIGFIVRNGDVNITNNTNRTITIQASIFAPNGTISVSGNNIKLVGSFVAKDFSASGSNITISYDSRKEASYPPGFRDLKLPLIEGE